MRRAQLQVQAAQEEAQRAISPLYLPYISRVSPYISPISPLYLLYISQVQAAQEEAQRARSEVTQLQAAAQTTPCLLYTSPSPRDLH